MSNASSGLWSDLIELNRRVDGMIERVRKAIEPTRPISREVPFYASLEARFDNLPRSFSSSVSVSTDATAGNNIKVIPWFNPSSRVYVRELSFETFNVKGTNIGPSHNADGRAVSEAIGSQVNWRWNFWTSITQRRYSDQRRVLAFSAGRSKAGNHLAFRQPLIIEPMETLNYECELLAFGENRSATTGDSCIIAMNISGYREGI